MTNRARVTRISGDPLDEPTILDVQAEVRRYVTAVLDNGEAAPDTSAEDIAQEAIARLLENAWRLDRSAAAGYALATARNLLISTRRSRNLAERHAPRLVEIEPPGDPQEAVVRAEERAALARALRRLPPKERDVLVQREVRARSLTDVAAEIGAKPAAVAATAARARGRLRLEYLLALHRIDLPTARCRPVLTALALGHRGRQADLGAGRHLATCTVCGELAVALSARDRHRVLAPVIVALAAGLAWVRRLVRSHPVATGGAAAAVTASVITGAILVRSQDPPAPPPPPPPRLQVAVGQVDLLPLAGQSLIRFAGSTARVDRVPVASVPADEGFWIGQGASRLWVQLRTARESPPVIRPGEVVTFTGTVVANDPGLAPRVGLSAAEGAGQLQNQAVHLAVAPSGLRITPAQPTPAQPTTPTPTRTR
jgi:RNA polymerase sigma factor (sigma-70 family)